MNNTDNRTNCQEVFEQLVAQIRSSYTTAVNLHVLTTAFEAALDYDTGGNNVSPPRLLRNLEVAQDLALLQCQTNLLLCAILLDVPREIVGTLPFQNVCETLDEYDRFIHLSSFWGNTDQLSEHRYHAVLLHCAKAHRELQDGNDSPVYNRAYLQSVLIPTAERLRMRYYVRLLYDDCYSKNLWDEQTYRYTDVTACIHALKSVSMDAYSTFDTWMLDMLARQSAFSVLHPDNPNPQEYAGKLRIARSCWEVKEQMMKAGTHERSMLDLWEVVISYEGTHEKNMVQDYIALHRKYLSDTLTIQYVESEDHCVTFRLTDTVDNNYLLRLIPRSELHTYYLGKKFDADADRLIHGNPTGVSCITVYAMVNNQCSKFVIPASATVLDLAFYVNPTDAVTVLGASIRQMTAAGPPVFDVTDHKYPLHMLLKDQDVVNFDLSSNNSGCHESHASIDWFVSINTDYAKACLIRYLKEQHPT